MCWLCQANIRKPNDNECRFEELKQANVLFVSLKKVSQ